MLGLLSASSNEQLPHSKWKHLQQTRDVDNGSRRTQHQMEQSEAVAERTVAVPLWRHMSKSSRDRVPMVL